MVERAEGLEWLLEMERGKKRATNDATNSVTHGATSIVHGKLREDAGLRVVFPVTLTAFLRFS